MKILREREFEDLVIWVTNIEIRIKDVMATSRPGKGYSQNSFDNVSYTSILAAILRLLDAKVLAKELQITGITLLRKIIEVENKELTTPSADWDTDEWTPYKRIIKMKQDSLVERGTIQFLCKHVSESEDPDIQEECLLACISLILGGN
jgi:hypothetical protein